MFHRNKDPDPKEAAKAAKKGVRYGNWARGEELKLLSLVRFIDT